MQLTKIYPNYLKPSQLKCTKWMQLTKNSNYSVSQNAPKSMQLTKIDQNSENPVSQIGPK